MTDSPPPPPVRYHYLDALRGFAMLLGIVLHGGLSYVSIPIWPAQDIHQNDALFRVLKDAIHGFRMPLFFLISGFFTTMLWHRRGLWKLVENRLLRILIPMIVGVVIIWPLIAGISTWGSAVKSGIAGERTEHSEWGVARSGDVGALRLLKEEGADLRMRDAMGITPLGWTAIMGHAEAAEILLEAGVELGPTDTESSTPLHSAAFFGRVEVVDLLVERGADISARNHRGETPLDVAAADWGVVVLIADIIGVELDETETRTGQREVREHLEALGAESGSASGGKDAAEIMTSIFYDAAFFPVFYHLWFLYYLLWLVAAFVLLASVIPKLGLRPPPLWILAPPGCLLWVLPLTLLPQWFMYQAFGSDTATGIVPWPPKLLYYSVFFFYGALCFSTPGWIERAGRRWPIWLAAALPALVIGVRAFGSGNDHHLLASVCAVVYAWAMVFAMLGACRKFLSPERGWVRYLSDSSYWLYIAHLPLLIGLQIAVSRWALPAELKFVLVCTLTFGALMLVYQSCVRYSVVGTILNGKKYRMQQGAVR